MSINSEMTALADAVRSKSGVTGKLTISGMTTAVSNIVINPEGGGSGAIDLSFVTAEAGDILSGKIGADKSGNPVYGTLELDSDIDLSGVTVTAGTMLEGFVAIDKNGETITGNIKTVTPSRNENVFSVEKGYVAEKTELTVPEADSVSISDNVVTIPVGYIKTQRTAAVAEAAEPTVTDNRVTINKGYISEQKTLTVAEMAEPEATDNVVTVEKGYNPAKKTVIIPEANQPTVTGNVVTVNKGYNKSTQTVTIPEMTVQNDGETVTIPVGYNKTEQHISIQGGGIDTSDATATADTMLDGFTAYADGVKFTGNIPTVTATLSENVTTVPAGYIAEEQTLTVSEAAEPTTSGNVVTVNKGYVKEQKKITVGTAKAAATITPGTTDLTIDAGTFLTGTQTIKGEVNLTPENIKVGVKIFGVTGTFRQLVFDDLTVTPENMLEGVLAIGRDGFFVTGAIPTVTPYEEDGNIIVPAGYIATERQFSTEADGYDTSIVTATADNMLAGTVAVGKNGETITGSVPTVEMLELFGHGQGRPDLYKIFRVAKGYIAEPEESYIRLMPDPRIEGNSVYLKNGYFDWGGGIDREWQFSVQDASITETDTEVTITPGYVHNELHYDLTGGSGIDFSGVNVTADKMLSGTVAIGANGSKVTGNIQTVTPYVQFNQGIVNVGCQKGYVSSTYSNQVSIPLAGITETDTEVTISPGYVSSELHYDLGGGGGGFVKITEYSPYEPAVSGISQIVVSGLTPAGSEDDGDYVDYSSANGTYLVTPETEKEPDPFKRVYKHSSEEWYIWASYEDYGDGYIEATWYIGPAADSGSLGYWTDGDLTSGSCTFEDWDWGFEFQVTLAVTKTDYPEVPMVLKGFKSTGYNTSTYTWAWDDESTNLSSFEGGMLNAVPQPYRIYASSGNGIIGNYLNYDGADLKALSPFWNSFSKASNTADSGQVCEVVGTDVEQRYTTVDGIPCMYFYSEGYVFNSYKKFAFGKSIGLAEGATLIVTFYMPERLEENSNLMQFTNNNNQILAGISLDAEYNRVYTYDLYAENVEIKPLEWHQAVLVGRRIPNPDYAEGDSVVQTELWVNGEMGGVSVGKMDPRSFINVTGVRMDHQFSFMPPKRDWQSDVYAGGYISDCYAVSHAMSPEEIKYTWNKFKSRITK